MKKAYVALFRGINVGGKHKLPMRDLVAILTRFGCEDVRTYIQSGNAVFRCETKDVPGLFERIPAAVEEAHGFAPQVLLLPGPEFEKAAAANPFPKAEAAPKTLHLTFLTAPPRKPDLASLDALKSQREQYALQGRVFYLHAPDGIGRSRLFQRVEKALGVAGTARNWRTVSELRAMLKKGA